MRGRCRAGCQGRCQPPSRRPRAGLAGATATTTCLAGARMADGVVEQVVEHLGDAVGSASVGPATRPPRAGRYRAGGQAGQVLDAGAGQVAQVHRLALQLRAPASARVRTSKSFDQADQPFGLVAMEARKPSRASRSSSAPSCSVSMLP